mmetsp:Transcript_71721/g.210633  ORF Transcript_71721/g.210633 Transcript_71721/m.210633 type:complete len:260 (+) Transcript_71721:2315-3094(+)
MARTPMSIPRRCSEACSGVMPLVMPGMPPAHLPRFWDPSRRAAMAPTRVLMPHAAVIPRALPLVTLQPEYTMCSGVRRCGSRRRGLAFFDTSSDSPVSGISLTFRSWASRSRRSAGATSPTPRTTMSPTTMELLGTATSAPSRSTTASGWAIFARASRALPAWFSVAAAMPAFSTTMTRIATPDGRLFTAKEAAAARTSSTIMKFVSCMRKSRKKPGLLFSSSLLGPSLASRCSASSSERPAVGATPRWRTSSSIGTRS